MKKYLRSYAFRPELLCVLVSVAAGRSHAGASHLSVRYYQQGNRG